MMSNCSHYFTPPAWVLSCISGSRRTNFWYYKRRPGEYRPGRPEEPIDRLNDRECLPVGHGLRTGVERPRAAIKGCAGNVRIVQDLAGGSDTVEPHAYMLEL